MTTVLALVIFGAGACFGSLLMALLSAHRFHAATQAEQS